MYITCFLYSSHATAAASFSASSDRAVSAEAAPAAPASEASVGACVDDAAAAEVSADVGCVAPPLASV